MGGKVHRLEVYDEIGGVKFQAKAPVANSTTAKPVVITRPVALAILIWISVRVMTGFPVFIVLHR